MFMLQLRFKRVGREMGHLQSSLQLCCLSLCDQNSHHTQQATTLCRHYLTNNCVKF